MYKNIKHMSGDSRVWIFQSDRFLDPEAQNHLRGRVSHFLSSWQAHGRDLQASFTIVYDLFMVVALDEASYQATGCSIDKLTRLVQELEREIGYRFLDRSQIAFRGDDKSIQALPMNEFRAALEKGEIKPETTVFNNLIETLQDFNERWETSVENSWHRQWLAQT